MTLGGTILAEGFGSGGTFTLTTPLIGFGDGIAATGTELPLDFFSKTGFANYNITSYKTDIEANTFTNGLGGYNAELATQTLTIGAGQTLDLSQSMFSPLVDSDQSAVLRGLATGGDLYSVLPPAVPSDTWDTLPVNLTLGGLVELEVAQGGSVIGAPGVSLTVGKLLNEGTIRLAGGTITQSEILPAFYNQSTTVAVDTSPTPSRRRPTARSTKATRTSSASRSTGMCSPMVSWPANAASICWASWAPMTASCWPPAA